VLVVDDDVSMLAIVLRWLFEAGHEAVTCQTVETATVCLQSWAPDVLLTDVRVGGTNGIFLAVLANQRVPRPTSIVMSGYEDPVLANEARSENARFLLKPFSRDQLLEAVLAPRLEPLQTGGSA
jgi:DNA-binding NtrC family response regulator